IAGMPVRSHSANISVSRAAPSSMEYSEWTCRCTKERSDPLPAGPAAMKSASLQACCHEPVRDGLLTSPTRAPGAISWVSSDAIARRRQPARDTPQPDPILTAMALRPRRHADGWRRRYGRRQPLVDWRLALWVEQRGHERYHSVASV